MPRDPEEDDDELAPELSEEELELLEDQANPPESELISALVLRPKEPMLAWARSVAPDAADEQLSASAVVLTPFLRHGEELERWLRQHHAVVFEAQLGAWNPQESGWPEDRSLEALRTCFDIEFVSIVDDMCHEDLRRDVTCDPVSLDVLVDAFDRMTEGSALFIDVTSGEIVIFTADELEAFDSGDVDHLHRPAAAAEDLKRRYASESLVEVLDRSDADEIQMMATFAEVAPIVGVRKRLLDAARSRKALRRFPEAVDAAGLRRAWQTFRRETLTLMLYSRLEELEIPSTGGLPGES